MAIIDLTNVDGENEERVYIKQEGKITLKVVKVTERLTQNNNTELKIHFQDKAGRWAIDSFVLTPNSLWRLKIFTKALKMPDVVNTDELIGRYVIATFKAKQTSKGGTIYEIKKYEPSKLTQPYQPKVPVVVENEHGETINEDEIPF